MKKFILLLSFILVSHSVHAKGDFGCIKKYGMQNIEYCKLESDIPSQKLSNQDIKYIVNGFYVLDKSVKNKYKSYSYQNKKYSNHTLIYNSKENNSNVYILRLWFDDKSCETDVSVNHNNKIYWNDDTNIWCNEERYK